MKFAKPELDWTKCWGLNFEDIDSIPINSQYYTTDIYNKYVLAFTLSYKHQWILDAQLHLNVIILHSKHIELKAA